MSEFSAFLASEISGQTPEQAFFHVIPAAFEASVSYGGGTANGPAAILEASQQLETWDGFSCPCDMGIFTTEPIDCGGDAEAVIALIKQAVQKVYAYGEKFPFLLGGEHTVTNGAIQALHENGVEFGIVQFDAHADLRDRYEGSTYSHACVMKRAVDLGIPVLQLGVRALSLEEVEVREQNPSRISYIDGYDLAKKGSDPFSWSDGALLPDWFPEKVYVTVDVDGLDPSIMPATGTPVPGGIGWYQMQQLLRKIAAERQIIGADIVELAPIEHLHAADFAAARLVYDLMGIVQRSRV